MHRNRRRQVIVLTFAFDLTPCGILRTLLMFPMVVVLLPRNIKGSRQKDV